MKALLRSTAAGFILALHCWFHVVGYVASTADVDNDAGLLFIKEPIDGTLIDPTPSSIPLPSRVPPSSSQAVEPISIPRSARSRSMQETTTTRQNSNNSSNNLQITTHYTRLTFTSSSSSSSSSTLPDTLSNEVRNEILNIASDILIENLSSDLEVMDVRIMDGGGGRRRRDRRVIRHLGRVPKVEEEEEGRAMVFSPHSTIQLLLRGQNDKTDQIENVNENSDNQNDGNETQAISKSQSQPELQLQVEKLEQQVQSTILRRNLVTNNPLSLHFKLRIRHPTWMAPSVSSYLIKAFRDHGDNFVQYFATAADDDGGSYSGIDTVEVETFDGDAFLLELQEQQQQQQQQQQGNNNVSESNSSSSGSGSSTSQLPTTTVPIQLTFEGIHDSYSHSIGFPSSLEEVILVEMSNILNSKMDPDVVLLEVVVFQGGGNVDGGRLLSSSSSSSRQLTTAQFFTEVLIQRPTWMTSSFARSQVLAALEENTTTLSNNIRQSSSSTTSSSTGGDDINYFSSLSNIIVSTFEPDFISSTGRPTPEPTRRPTPLPTKSPIIIERTVSTYLLQLVFDGITSASKNSQGFKNDLVDLVQQVLEEKLEQEFIVDGVVLYQVGGGDGDGRERLLGDGEEEMQQNNDQHQYQLQRQQEYLHQEIMKTTKQTQTQQRQQHHHRRLATLTMPIEITIRHPIATQSDHVFEKILVTLIDNFDTLGKYIRTTPGNEDYISFPDISKYDPYEFFISQRPTRRPTLPPAAGYKTNSFPIDFVFEGVSPYYVISPKLAQEIAFLAEDILRGNLDSEIELVDVTLPPEQWGIGRDRSLEHYSDHYSHPPHGPLEQEQQQKRQQQRRRYDVENRDLQDWFLLPLLFTLQYRVDRDDALAVAFVALSDNIDDMDDYLHEHVGGVFDGMTKVIVQHHFAELDTAPPTVSPPAAMTIKQSNAAVPWWVWVVVAAGVIVIVIVFFFMCGMTASTKQSLKNKHARATDDLFTPRDTLVRFEEPDSDPEYHPRRSHRDRSERKRSKERHKKKKKKHRRKRREWDEELPMLPAPKRDYPMLPPSQHQQHLALPAPHNHQHLALPAPPPQIRSDSMISDLTVSVYPPGDGISTVQNEAVHSTALVIYEERNDFKAPDPDEFILDQPPKKKESDRRQNHPNKKGSTPPSLNAFARVNKATRRDRGDNTALIFSP